MEIKFAALALIIIASSVSALDYVLVQEYLASPAAPEASEITYSGPNVLSSLNCLGKIPASLCETYKGYILSATKNNFPYKCASKFSPAKFAVLTYFQAEHESARSWNKNAFLAKDLSKNILESSYGLMQFTEGTANGFGIGIAGALEPSIAIPTAVKYMASFLQKPKVNCDYRLALVAYNTGHVLDYIPQNGRTPGYVADITSKAEDYWRKLQPAPAA